MDDRQRQRMWWEAATTATTGLLAFLTRETYPDIPIPDRVSLLVVRVAGQYADDLLAEYDRRFPTPHPAPADATGEGEDYELLFTAAPGVEVPATCPATGTPITRIGRVVEAGAPTPHSTDAPVVVIDGERVYDVSELGWDH